MTGGRPSRGASSGVASGASGPVSAGVSSGRGVGSVLSCRPPSCRSSSVGSPGPRVRHRAGAGRDAGRGSPAQRARARLAVPMLESLAAGRGRRDPGGARRAAADRPRCRAPPARPCRCRSRSVSSAVQEARISTSTVCSGPGEVAEPRRGGAGDRAADVVVGGAGLGEGVGQPAPGDLGEHRVVDQFLVGLRREVADAAGRAVPGLVALRVEQDDEPGAGDLEVLAPVRVGLGDPRADGVRPRGEPLRGGDVLEDDLRAGPGRRASASRAARNAAGGSSPPSRPCPCLGPRRRPGWWAPRAQGRPPDSTPRPTRRTHPGMSSRPVPTNRSAGVWEDGQS